MMLSLVTALSDGGFCSAPSLFDAEKDSKPRYWKVTNPTLSPSHLQGAYLHAGYGLALCDVLSKDARFIFVVQGSVTLTNTSSTSHKLMVDSYAYLPPNFEHSVECDASATLAVFERRYASLDNLITELIVGSTDEQPILETPGEVFELRKLLPPSLPYDFNIHIMDFQPGEFLNVKVCFLSD
ncbi:hypothetical protein GH714_030893 [Hevea brasiliensis]|uniref:Cupin type-1 domain-containing protein n=1 Tax=Hevea brasiliensis TaxID=3981 RepID=A0A6A6LCJ5_HEVBR|nr:hypothetical protein GH714_030893 [Hevea brasiliensis]